MKTNKNIFLTPLLALFFIPLTSTHLAAQYTPPTLIDQTRFYDNFHRPLDWDSDGDLDFIGSQGGATLHLYENIGGGRLADPVVLAVVSPHGCLHYCASLADLNADGRMDMVLQYPDIVRIYQQGANGQLLEAQSFPTEGTNTPAAKLADMDADGDLDLVRFHLDSLRWNENDGTGHFQNEFFIAAAPPVFIHLNAMCADMNNDGRTDVFFYDLYNNDTLPLYLNNAGNPFTRKDVPIPTVIDLAFVFFGKSDQETNGLPDLDNDGLPDLLVGATSNTPFVHWYKNLGDGNFSLPVPLDPSPPQFIGAVALIPGDLDVDGDIDILSRNLDTLAWYENDGTGQFAFHLALLERGVQDLNMSTIADWDNDGLPDILCTADWSNFGLVAVIKNLGGGQFAPRQFIAPEFAQVQEAQVADLDGDGQKDLLIATYLDMKLAWYQGLGGGQWSEQRLIDSLQYYQIFTLAADLDGDGDADLLNARDVEDQFLYRSELFWHENLGGGQFGPSKMLIPGIRLFTEKAWVLDLDADGDLDLVFVLGGTVPSIVLLLNEGAGHFALPVFVDPNSQIYNILDVTDMDLDGDPDIAVSIPNGLKWYRNDGAANFDGPQILSSSQTIYAGMADLDGDHLPDLLNWNQAGIAWERNPGNGEPFEPEQLLGPKPFFFYNNNFRVADLNGDGLNDLLGGFDDMSYGWLPNLGGGNFGERIVLGAMIAGYDLFRSEDIDNDGSNDFLFINNNKIQYHTSLEELPSIRGIFFRDDNENGLQEPDEALLPGIAATLSPSPLLGLSDGSGAFRFFASFGDYTLGFRPDSCWVLSSDSATFQVSLPALSGGTPIHRFGFRPNLSFSKISPFATSSQPICGFSVPFWLTLRNDGCHPARARLRFFPGDRLTFESALPAPASVSNDMILWESDTLLQPGQTQLITAAVNIAPALAGEALTVLATAETLTADGLTVIRADTTTYSFQVLCSFDPNDKAVNINELPPGYGPDSSELTYTIRFQNTGNFTAFNIRIRDTLAPALDRASFRPLAASHQYYTSLDTTTGVLTYEFNNIQLADSTHDEPASHGFAAFSIRLKPGLPPGSVTRNRAGIYFDVNLPVITNSAETQVRMSVSVKNPAAELRVSVSPNPATDELRVSWSRKSQGVCRVQIFDLRGVLVLERTVPGGVDTCRLDVSGLPAAAYFLKIKENGSAAFGQALFVKI